MRFIITFCFFVFLSDSFSQTISKQEQIKNYIQNYFLYDRENIHVQFNKNSFVNNEDLAFKGYVYSKNNNVANENTTNVQLVVYDSQQNVIEKQLLYTNKGIFTGGIHLNDNFKSGFYYFHFFTNWMNNFREDDSFTQTIEIINKNETYYFKSNEPNIETTKVAFFPEGGNIINGVFNTVGVRITDCNQKGIEIKDIIVHDSKSNEVARFTTNKMGNGMFNFTPNINETYTLNINSKKLTLSKPLPVIQETGIILTYNNKVIGDKVAVSIKTNDKGLELYGNKKYTLLIQQDGYSIIQEISFKNKELENSYIIDNKYLSNGVNSIRLIDENLNEICERLIYNYEFNNPITNLDAKTIANDSIKLSCKIGVSLTNLSVSVLPEKNTCINQKRSILGTFYLNAYLENPEIDNYSYFDMENNNRFEEMNLLMLNQTHSKYNWGNIKSNPPKINYNSEKGVTIKGKVDKEITTNSKFRISLFSLKDNVNDETTVDKNGEFKFENFYAKDSSVFIMQMINEKNLVIKTNITSRVNRNESPYIYSLRINKINCPIIKNEEKSIVLNSPNPYKKKIILEDVKVINNYKKEELIHKNEMSFNARGYKIADNEFGNVLDFLETHGYHAGIDMNNRVYININSNRGYNTIRKSDQSPSVYINNNLLYDFTFLPNINMQDVDEIYIDRYSLIYATPGSTGCIKIFLKQDLYKKTRFNIKYSSLVVTKGFAKDFEFKNTEFDTQEGFYNFGTLFWSPNINLTNHPNFEIKFPRENQEEIQVLIEGFSMDGQLISEIKTIPVSN
jgi:hypothetical protein